MSLYEGKTPPENWLEKKLLQSYSKIPSIIALNKKTVAFPYIPENLETSGMISITDDIWIPNNWITDDLKPETQRFFNLSSEGEPNKKFVYICATLGSMPTTTNEVPGYPFHI